MRAPATFAELCEAARKKLGLVTPAERLRVTLRAGAGGLDADMDASSFDTLEAHDHLVFEEAGATIVLVHGTDEYSTHELQARVRDRAAFDGFYGLKRGLESGLQLAFTLARCAQLPSARRAVCPDGVY